MSNGFEDWTMDDVIAHATRVHLNTKLDKALYGKKKPIVAQASIDKTTRSKYGNIKTNVDGVIFDSKKEANRYTRLKLLLQSGVITDLECQVEFILQPDYEINGKKVQSLKYIADFVYTKDGKMVVEDVKGNKTDVYKIKKKIFEYIYKTEILET